RYKKLRASTNDAYCPTLRGVVKTALPDNVGAVYEIVIDGIDQAAVEHAMATGIRAACRPGIVRISAGNYGGNLGPFHFHLPRIRWEARRRRAKNCHARRWRPLKRLRTAGSRPSFPCLPALVLSLPGRYKFGGESWIFSSVYREEDRMSISVSAVRPALP